MGGLFIDIYIVYLLRILIRAFNLLRSRSWPITSGVVLSADCPGDSLYPLAFVTYEYIVSGEKYGGWYEKPFLLSESAAGYARKFVKGADFRVRVKPGDRSISIPEG